MKSIVPCIVSRTAASRCSTFAFTCPSSPRLVACSVCPIWRRMLSMLVRTRSTSFTCRRTLACVRRRMLAWMKRQRAGIPVSSMSWNTWALPSSTRTPDSFWYSTAEHVNTGSVYRWASCFRLCGSSPASACISRMPSTKSRRTRRVVNALRARAASSVVRCVFSPRLSQISDRSRLSVWVAMNTSCPYSPSISTCRRNAWPSISFAVLSLTARLMLATIMILSASFR
mmetsp:Transcript_95113/g.164187  ORF Transcript_95113/g.164187 Transcript_95113/m.164187 type:complete len:228 (-) Transcript_95113:1079-1762(-)